MKNLTITIWLTIASLAPGAAVADSAWSNPDDTRYMALGDSLAAGWGAEPATQGYVYRLYREGAFDQSGRTLLTNVGVPGATSADVLAHQVPMALTRVHPDVITLTVGGNDLLAILTGSDPAAVLAEFQTNLIAIVAALRSSLPDADIAVANLYVVDEIPGAADVVPIFNQIVDQVASGFGVRVADLNAAFAGKPGLLQVERPHAAAFEVHPTNAGHGVIARAFEEARVPQ